ncbi:MAG TPA: glucose 1-dehydrogenase [Candidatus Methylomirabilis sp.]|nr:glucose 1-dehydrogenase [Candidatus Methylomirabilis sp.]
MSRLFDLSGQVALVTGASRGFGRSIARALAEAGTDLVLTSRRLQDVEGVAGELTATGRKVVPLQADVTRGEDVEEVVGRALAILGKIDILVNNAGINIRRPALDLTESDWDQTLETNLKGCFRVAKAVGRHMMSRQTGRIVNIASMMASVTLPERAAYGASKAGLVQLTRTLAVEWAPYNVRVNAICPGPFLTELNRPILDDPEKVKFFTDRMPMKRFGRPEELHGAVIFLASEASSFITGTTIYIDGGWTAL